MRIRGTEAGRPRTSAPRRERDSWRGAPSGERTEALAGLLLVVLIALLVYSLSSPLMTSIILCPFRRLTGWPCPGCGMTRALNALAHGQWEVALSLHPLSPIAAAGWLLLGLSTLLKVVFPSCASLRRWGVLGKRIRMSTWIVGLASVLVLGVWVIRLIALIASGEAGVLFRQGWLGRILAS